MILYRYMSKKQLKQFKEGEMLDINCMKDKNNDGAFVAYDSDYVYFTTSIEELKIQRASYKTLNPFDTTYLCSFNIPSSALIGALKVGREVGYDGKKTTLFGVSKMRLKPNYLHSTLESLRKSNVEIANSEIGLVEVGEVISFNKNNSTDERLR